MTDQQMSALEEQKRMSLIRSISYLRGADQVGLNKISNPSFSPSFSGVDAALLSYQAAGNALRQQAAALESLASFGLPPNNQHHHLFPSISTEMPLFLQLQKHQLQLQQQQQLLMQADRLAAGPGFGRGMGGGIGPGLFTLPGNEATGRLEGRGAGHGSMSQVNALGDSSGLNALATTNLLNDSVKPSMPSMLSSPRSESFPMTLLRILTDIEGAGGPEQIAHFVAGGDAFAIRNARIFEESIIPKYFPRMGSFGSFQRQLNLYDFKRISHGAHRGAYTHPLFRRDFPGLARQMKRTKIKGLRGAPKKGENKEKSSKEEVTEE